MKKNILLPTIAACIILFSCQKESGEIISETVSTSALSARSEGDKHFNIFKGPEVQVGNGKVRSWIKISHEDQPIEIGVEWTDDALTGLPEHDVPNEPHPHWDIPLHQKAKDATPFDHVEINWNPEGHPPTGVFDVPHFDAHFYMISEAARMAIGGTDPEMKILPPPDQRPAGYVPTMDGISAMGMHWIAPPILPPFTKVLIWGSYNGVMTFIEPMVTVAYLRSGASSSLSFGQPAVFPKKGNYPTKYNIYKDDNNNHQVTLSDFVAR